MSEQQIDKSM